MFKLVENDNLDYKIYESVLSKAECEYIISNLKNWKQSTVFSRKGETEQLDRKSESTIELENSPILDKVKKIISNLTKTEISKQEHPISIVKYEVGGEFKPHYDYIGNMFNVDERAHKGEREKTAILYLNDDYDGGETYFPLEDIKINPKEGNLLVFSNLNKNGQPNEKTLHSGLPVKRGIKYILVCFIRQKTGNEISFI